MKPYTVASVAQGSPEWKRLRLTKVTASKVPALLGLCPYQSADSVLAEMLTGKEREFTASKLALFRKGHETETRIRRRVEFSRGYRLPSTVLVSTRQPMLMASLDGYNCEKHIGLEAKLVGKVKLQEIRAGRIPLHHMAQVQTQLLVSGARSFIYAAMTFGECYAAQEIHPDPAYAARILECVEAFLKRLKPEPTQEEMDFEEEVRAVERMVAIEVSFMELQARRNTIVCRSPEPVVASKRKRFWLF